MKSPFVIEPLGSEHDRHSFSCGVEALDRYLHTLAGQDVRRRIANCFIARDRKSGATAAYYTLAATSIPLVDLPQGLAKRLPRYPVVPAALIGRLAVDRRYQNRSLGSALLFDAIRRVMRADPAVYALVVDAKDETAAAFYRHFGFQGFAERPRSFYLPLATAHGLE